MKPPAQTVPRKFQFYPVNQVVAVIDAAVDAAAARAEFDRVGFTNDAVEVRTGALGLRRLDETGARHGLAGRLLRLLQGYGDMEQKTFSRQADALRAGHSLVGVRVRNAGEQRRVEVILKRHHGHFINYFGRWAITGLAA